ncbi:MAG: hypothetical protein KGD57_01880, partial [Candidatus Lokiarchaeota archaeon]|nr:hypothetical protein [Candidatus Lokiarchaeota archaeon]
ELNYNNDNYEEVVNNDKYKHDLISKIINVYSIKKPTLVINDIYYLLEKAGPFIYRDSKLRKTSLLVMGNNALAVDIIMLRILGLDIEKNDLISEIKKRGLGLKSFDDIKCLGENLEEISMKINQCHSKLEDIKVQNLSVLTGRLCSGCFLKGYHLFNFIKSLLVKDLKYLRKFSILVGLNPPEPQNKNNIIVFGKCAIKTTQNYAFRTLTKKKMFKKKDKNVQNKAILEIHGCPPDLRICLKKIFDFFGKSELPELNFLLKILESSNLCKYNEEIKI